MDPNSRLPDMRASDADRERVLAVLRDAHSEGRLDIDDFYQRLDAVYQAKTYGELATVTRDLPASAPRPAAKPRQDLHTPPPPPRPATMPRGLRAMWLLWLAAVSINVLIWLLVAVGTGHLPYFWPFWVAGPWGAVLASLTIVWYVAGNRGSDGGTPPQLPRR